MHSCCKVPLKLGKRKYTVVKVIGYGGNEVKNSSLLYNTVIMLDRMIFKILHFTQVCAV